MLKTVKILDYSASYTYAPPAVDSIINTSDIMSAKPTEARGTGPFLKVKFRDGSTEIIVGQIEDVMDENIKIKSNTDIIKALASLEAKLDSSLKYSLSTCDLYDYHYAVDQAFSKLKEVIEKTYAV